MDSSAVLYDVNGVRIASVDSSGYVRNASGEEIGKVHGAGGGDVHTADSDGVYCRMEGDVNSVGQVATGVGEDRKVIGHVRGSSVYDDSGRQVGRVDAQSSTTYLGTGITDQQRAGAAMLLLPL